MNPRGYSTYFRFDLLGRPSHRIHALGGVAYMGYDEVGNRILNLDELGNPTYFTFDGLNRRTHVKDALMAVSYMGFDNRSSPVKRVDADGRCIYMGYDASRRLDKQWFANPVAGESADMPAYFAYNEASELARVDDRLKGFGWSYYDRDVMGRVVKKGTAAGGVYYAFDVSGMRTSLKDPGLAENVYVWDAVGRLDKEQLSAGRTVYFAYDRAGLLTKRLLPGGESGLPHRVMSYLFYDAAARTLRIENRGSAWDTIINYFHYERNANGLPNRIRREDDKDTYFEWDARDLLIYEQQHTGTTIDLCNYYTYDLFGNQQQKTATQSGSPKTNYYFFDQRNLDVKETYPHESTPFALYFEYDSSHRLLNRKTTENAGAPWSHYFTHDQLQRATSVEIMPTVVGADKFQMGFNAVGERVAKRDNNAASVAYLAWDGDELLHQGPAGGTSTTYRYRHNQSATLWSMVEFDPVAFGTPKQLPAGDMSARKHCQSEGASVSSRSYNAFGIRISESVGSGLTSQFFLRFLPGDGHYAANTIGDMSLGWPLTIFNSAGLGLGASADAQANAKRGVGANLGTPGNDLGFNQDQPAQMSAVSSSDALPMTPVMGEILDKYNPFAGWEEGPFGPTKSRLPSRDPYQADRGFPADKDEQLKYRLQHGSRMPKSCFEICMEEIGHPLVGFPSVPHWIKIILCSCLCIRHEFAKMRETKKPTRRVEAWLEYTWAQILHNYRGENGPPEARESGLPNAKRMRVNNAGLSASWGEHSQASDPSGVRLGDTEVGGNPPQRFTAKITVYFGAGREMQFPIHGDFREDLTACACLFDTILHELMHAEYFADPETQKLNLTEDQQHQFIKPDVDNYMKSIGLPPCD